VTSAPDGELHILDNRAGQRYEARLGDRTVGFSEYRRVGDRLIFHHTEVDPAVEGRGIGSRLAQGALDDARLQGLRITVKCPFIAAWLQRHPGYGDLMVAAPGATRTPARRDT
jgi:hypothetical protein